MQKAISFHKTEPPINPQKIIFFFFISVCIGILQKLFHLGSVYEPHLMGLTPKDFIAFGIIAFLLATAIASRRMLKHLELLVAKK